jgi:formylmethanofuran dehydrogenase subunit B
MKKLLTMIVVGIGIAIHAHAGMAEKLVQRALTGVASPCKLTETVSISVNFNTQVPSPTKAKETFDGMLATVKAEAATLKVENFMLQSMNYSMNPNQYGNMVSGYGLNGSMSFQMKDVDKASALMEALNGKNMTASLNVSAYNNNGVACSNPVIQE